MPKHLWIIRHAKAKDNEAGEADFDRKLSKRGKEDAEEMALELKKIGIAPQKIYVSPAKRTRKTAEIMAEVLAYAENDLVEVSGVYEASQQTLLKIINNFDDAADRAFLIGHNPGLTLIADYLSDKDIDFLPTCGIAYIQFDFDSWQLVSRNTGKLQWLKSPKEI
ncbi:MAG: histidine phosphatase family protein [Microscillaceae bacterium]|jgi:phosphohistidine phosphatase|nr:histidine phosphatase family protein [Microscillaceae bacterium]